MSRKTFMVIDGNSLAHRAFHAIPLLSNSEGVITNAVYGFTTMLFKVLEDHSPQLVAVAFDKGKITFRHSRYSDYKMHRKPTPEELRPQFPLLKEILNAFQIPIFEVENYEADDLIGTISLQAEKKGYHCLIVTGDQDILQLVSPNTTVLHTVKGITEMEHYDTKKVEEKFGVPPERFADLKGLMGDSSDNIPGVPGIGQKTAAKLLQEYTNMDKLLQNKEQVQKRWRNKLVEYEEQAIMSKELATIMREAPIDINFNDCKWSGPDYSQLIKIFSRLEFKSLIKNIMNDESNFNNQSDADSSSKLDAYYADWKTIKSEFTEIKQKIEESKEASISFELTKDGKLSALALTVPTDINYYIPLPNGIIPKEILDILSNTSINKYAHGAKEIIRTMYFQGMQFRELSFDTMIAAYLLNTNYSALELSDLVLQYLNVVLPAQEGENITAGAESIFKIKELLQNRLEENDLEELYYNIELPLISILAEMEANGITVDAEKLHEMSLELDKQINELSDEIFSLCGEKFNINSPKQLGYILFEKLGLPVIKRTKTGYSTNAEVLEELAQSHPVPQKIIEHRQLVKLKTTYVDSMTNLINPETGKLHTTFHQAVTATGRLSSTEPNLQNIPIRLEQGRKIRKVFIPHEPNNLILTADYSQIELRILAHMSGDTLLQEAFLEGQDIHARTASEVFGVNMNEVTKELRSRAKAVNFGIVYGMSEFGLSKDINVSRAEAKSYIDNYFERYSGVRNFIKETIEKAKENGYVTTILNRRRYLPDLFSPNRNVRNFGERAAINTPIQGSAADIIKIAMVNVRKKMAEYNLQTKILLQVHDELIFDVPENELTVLKELVRGCMEDAYELNVPLTIDLKAGKNWYDVEEI